MTTEYCEFNIFMHRICHILYDHAPGKSASHTQAHFCQKIPNIFSDEIIANFAEMSESHYNI